MLGLANLHRVARHLHIVKGQPKDGVNIPLKRQKKNLMPC